MTNTVQRIWPDIKVRFSDCILSQSRRGVLIRSPCLSVFLCESQVLPLSLLVPFLLLTVPTTHHVATILSPLDLLYHASVVLSEASCSFGSENSVMSVLAGRGGHAIPTERNKPRGCDAIICFFGGGCRARSSLVRV